MIDAQPMSTPPLTVLVIEDDRLVRSLAQRMLEHFGYQVVCTGSGESGIEVVHRESDRLAAVLLDLTLPNMSGMQVLEGIRSADPDLPVVLTSGHLESEVHGLEDSSCAFFLQKPFLPRDLAACLERVRRIPT